MFTILGWLLVGLLAGGLARLLVPGRQAMGCLATSLLGIAGSFVGGFLASLFFGEGLELRTSSIIGSVIGAVILLLVLESLVGRRQPRGRRRR